VFVQDKPASGARLAPPFQERSERNETVTTTGDRSAPLAVIALDTIAIGSGAARGRIDPRKPRTSR
jgi:hypothetical protein